LIDRRASGEIIVDRRRASRTPLRFEVVCAHEGASFDATARNLTCYGVFVETEERVPADAPLELTLYLPDDETAPAKVMARVTRPAQRANEVPGFAADFEGVDETTALRIAVLLKPGG